MFSHVRRRSANTVSLNTVASSGSTTSLLRHHNQPESDPERDSLRPPVFTNSNYPSRAGNAKSSNVDQSPYSAAMQSSNSELSLPRSLASKFSFSPDPNLWGSNLSPRVPEPDDFLHLPDARDGHYKFGDFMTQRSFANMGCLAIVFFGLITLFAGYPLIAHFTSHQLTSMGGFNIGGINGTGMMPNFTSRLTPIDPDTPEDVRTITSKVDGTTQMELVFSDEFNTDGRTFYPGDDPYWEAVDLWYWETNDLEWYDPSAITTKGGSLQITLSNTETHNLSMQGGMMSSWNKFCFTGGYIEVNVSLPLKDDVVGTWPAIWTLGNLGRAGYGASLDGMWPYTYDTCDVGTVANQSVNGIPQDALTSGPANVGGTLSYLTGQRLSRCTCKGESHPGPVHASDGTYVGRSAPEIDIFEAQVTPNAAGSMVGAVSQSAQFAPFDQGYMWNNDSSNLIIPNPDITALNPYIGGPTQEAASGVTQTNPQCYENGGGLYDVYGYEYSPGLGDDAYIAWISSGKMAWQLKQPGFDANNNVEIGPRPIPQEPMSIIINLASSQNFATFDPADLKALLPAHLLVDYVRVYQPAGQPNNIGCDPPDFPTADYINTYIEAYTNPNVTSWVEGYGQEWPKNSFLKQCTTST